MTPSRGGSFGSGPIAAALTLSIVTAAAPATPAQTSASARDGVFSKEQVARGRAAYNTQCARCHGETLGGGENSPARVDEAFFKIWDGKSVGELVEYTRKTMPSDGPGTVSRRRCIDIAAYLLSTNGFPAGDREFPTELDALNQIAITRTR